MRTIKPALIAGLFVLIATPPLYAALKASAVRPGNHIFLHGTNNLVPLDAAGATELAFSGSGRFTITYSAECAVSAAAGNHSTWLNIDIELIPDAAAPVVQVLDPTAGIADAFCTSNGTAGSDGWTRASITVPTPSLPATSHRVRIRASIANGASGTSGLLGDAALVVEK